MKQKKVNGLEHGYTDEEIKGIRENFKKAFGRPYGIISARLKELTSKRPEVLENQFYIGRQFYTFLYKQNAGKYGLNEGYHKIEITYVRSGVVFYEIIDAKKNKEELNFDIGSHFSNELIPTEIRFFNLSMLSKNRVLFQLEFSPLLAGETIPVYDEHQNRLQDIIIGDDGLEIKTDI